MVGAGLDGPQSWIWTSKRPFTPSTTTPRFPTAPSSFAKFFKILGPPLKMLRPSADNSGLYKKKVPNRDLNSDRVSPVPPSLHRKICPKICKITRVILTYPEINYILYWVENSGLPEWCQTTILKSQLVGRFTPHLVRKGTPLNDEPSPL